MCSVDGSGGVGGQLGSLRELDVGNREGERRDMESRVGEDKRKVLLDFQMSICTCANISSVRACAPISDIVGPTVALSRTVIIVLCGATGSGTRRRRTRPPMALPLQPLPPRVPAAEAGPVTAGESGKATLGGARRRRRGAARASPGRRRRLARESWRTCWTTCRWRSGGCMRPMPLSTPRSPQLRADKTQHARTHARTCTRAHARAHTHTHCKRPTPPFTPRSAAFAAAYLRRRAGERTSPPLWTAMWLLCAYSGESPVEGMGSKATRH
jgi:hypothetical protein